MAGSLALRPRLQLENPPLKHIPGYENKAGLGHGNTREIRSVGTGHSTLQAQKGQAWLEVSSKSTCRPSFSRLQPVPLSPGVVIWSLGDRQPRAREPNAAKPVLGTRLIGAR